MKPDPMSRKSFLVYLLQIPFVGGIAKMLHVLHPEKHYLLNKFSIAGFDFYNGKNYLHQMKLGEPLTMKAEPKNKFDEFAIELFWQDKKVGYVPKSDNRHLFRLIKQEKQLVCTIREINPDEVTWQMCKVKVEMKQ